MPSAASELNVSQAFQPLLPIRKSDPNGSKDGPSPFAAMLDASAATPDTPPPLPSRNDRPARNDARADRSDDTPPAQSRQADDAPAAKDTKSGKDGKDTDKADNAEKTDKPEKKADAASDAKDAKAADQAIVDPEAILAVDASAKADVAAPLVAPVPVAAAAATVAAAAPATAAPDAEQLSAIAAAGAATTPATDAPAKPAPKDEAKADAAATIKGAASDKGAAATEGTPAVKPGEGRKDEAPQANSEHAAKHAHPVGDDRPATGPEAAPRVADAAGAVKAGSDAVQNLGLTAPAQHAVAAASTQANVAPAAATAAVPLAGVAVEITTQAQAGKNRFEIRLDPPELGRIDVRLDVDKDGNVTSRLTVDRVETFDLLKRDASQLERALQQAGLKTADNALQFSLRDQSLARDDRNAPAAPRLVAPEPEAAPLDVTRRYGVIGLGSGLDIRI